MTRASHCTCTLPSACARQELSIRQCLGAFTLSSMCSSGCRPQILIFCATSLTHWRKQRQILLPVERRKACSKKYRKGFGELSKPWRCKTTFIAYSISNPPGISQSHFGFRTEKKPGLRVWRRLWLDCQPWSLWLVLGISSHLSVQQI